MNINQIHDCNNNSFGQRAQNLAIRLVEKTEGYTIVNAVAGRLSGTVLKPIGRIADVVQHIFHTLTHLVFGTIAFLTHNTIGRCTQIWKQKYFISHGFTHLAMAYTFFWEIIPSLGNLVDPRIFKPDNRDLVTRTEERDKAVKQVEASDKIVKEHNNQITALQAQIAERPEPTPSSITPPILPPEPTPSPIIPPPPPPPPPPPTPPPQPRILRSSPSPTSSSSLSLDDRSSSPEMGADEIQELAKKAVVAEKFKTILEEITNNRIDRHISEDGCSSSQGPIGLLKTVNDMFNDLGIDVEQFYDYENTKDLWNSELTHHFRYPQGATYVCSITELTYCPWKTVDVSPIIAKLKKSIKELNKLSKLETLPLAVKNSSINKSTLVNANQADTKEQRIAVLAEKFGRLLRTWAFIKDQAARNQVTAKPINHDNQTKINIEKERIEKETLQAAEVFNNRFGDLKNLLKSKIELIKNGNELRAIGINEILGRHLPRNTNDIEFLEYRNILNCLSDLKIKYEEYFKDKCELMSGVEKELYSASEALPQIKAPSTSASSGFAFGNEAEDYDWEKYGDVDLGDRLTSMPDFASTLGTLLPK